jgi:hypothetical protein
MTCCTRVDAVLTLDDEMLVLLRGGAPERSIWLHSGLAVPAVVMLARWRDAHTPIEVTEDGGDTVLTPKTEQIGLRFRDQGFRGQPALGGVEMWRVRG